MANTKANNVDIKIINDDKQLELFKELSIQIQNRVIQSGLKSAGNIIMKEIKSSWNTVKKNKSKNNYQFIKFSIEATKSGDSYGVKIGVKNYKLRWIEWGTKERTYTVKKRGLFNKKKGSKQTTGKIEATHFFYNAVDAKKGEAQENMSSAIMKSLERTVQKYEK